ncbi:ABC transporter ATP-binding protein [Fuerstiella marisgermanici]|uniref:Putative ABC transporter ATP-binding protein YbhF n=1 Tax=Fuerstiella marisgermanici TaxID=1891926 RepID=A0A1P8WS15_9PLAN|nr:ABC transporter ATP-binding protein [Fuerstiella marisgermanici]APZ96852.1 putative ABC transporter ATP-binding protein YbhF [Fuerstiella marisgermanici]
MSVLVTHSLCKSYGARRGVNDINLTVDHGEIFGFLGPNGAGKSTTIRLLMGFLKPSSGTATIFGKDCWTDSESVKRDLGYVAGDVRLYPWLTARRAFRIVGEIRHQDLFEEGLKLAERFRLEPDLPVRKMSRGNRQKLALVMALAHRPKLVILDEPTSGLDPLMQDTLADCLKEMASEGRTIFFSSHTLSEVESLCDRIAIVRDGRIVADEKLATMKQRAPRSVILTFATDEAATLCETPEFLHKQKQTANQIHLQLHGPAIELTNWAATQTITDISIGPPNLESLFRRYYQTDEAAAASVEAQQ